MAISDQVKTIAQRQGPACTARLGTSRFLSLRARCAADPLIAASETADHRRAGSSYLVAE